MKTYLCKYCGKSFEDWAYKKCSFCSCKCANLYKREQDKEEVKCKYCGELFKRSCKRKKKKVFCSKSCANRYHAPFTKEKLMKEEGIPSTACRKSTQLKARKTQFKNHNGRYAFNTEKRKQTNLRKYGVENYTTIINRTSAYVSDKEKERRIKEAFLKEGRKLTKDELDILFPEYENPDLFRSKQKLEKLGVRNLCNLGSRKSSTSKKWKKLIEENLNIKLEEESNLPYKGTKWKCDFLYKNLAIEINPTITHNVEFNPFSEPVSKDYHAKRSNLARKNGFYLIHIWDWDKEEDVLDLIRKTLTLPSFPIALLQGSSPPTVYSKPGTKKTSERPKKGYYLVYTENIKERSKNE